MSTAITDIPKGYKQTEMGMIPEDWELSTFGDIFKFYSTASNSRDDLSESGDTYYIHYGDIHTIFHRHLDFGKSKPPKIFRDICRNAALIQNGDWIMADASEDYSGVGKSIEVVGLSEKIPVISGLHTILLREKNPTFVTGFKGHLGEMKELHNQYLRVAVGLKVFGVTKTALSGLLLPIPPKIEQHKITKILSNMDEIIESLEQLIAKKHHMKKGTMQELLTGKTRLPGFSGEWKLKKLGDFFEIFTSNSKINLSKNRYFLMEMGSVTEDGLLSPEKRTKNSASMLYIDDLIMPTRDIGEGRIIGKVGLINKNHQYVLGNNLYCLRKKSDSINVKCFYYLINSYSVNLSLKSKTTKTVQLALNKNMVEKQNIVFPSTLQEQEAIANILSDMDAEITALERRRDKLMDLKQGMMQQLLTGRIRLVEASA